MAGFHLCPTWEEPAPAAGELVIRLEPGLAFGSGYHPTTQGCLTLMRRVFEADPPGQVLDLGTGTGILTLAALALGAKRVVAVEYNELAVRTAARNLKHNQREQRRPAAPGRRPALRPYPGRAGPGQHPPGRPPGPAGYPGVSGQKMVHLLRPPGDPDGPVHRPP